MRHRALVVLIGFLATLLWAALLVLMNRKPPTALNQAIFLLLLGGAVTCTAIPTALLVQERRAYRDRRGVAGLGWGANPGRAGRQGVLAGMLAAALMALRFLGMLNVLLAVFLVLVAVMIEMLARTRETY